MFTSFSPCNIFLPTLPFTFLGNEYTFFFTLNLVDLLMLPCCFSVKVIGGTGTYFHAITLTTGFVNIHPFRRNFEYVIVKDHVTTLLPLNRSS